MGTKDNSQIDKEVYLQEEIEAMSKLLIENGIEIQNLKLEIIKLRARLASVVFDAPIPPS